MLAAGHDDIYIYIYIYINYRPLKCILQAFFKLIVITIYIYIYIYIFLGKRFNQIDMSYKEIYL